MENLIKCLQEKENNENSDDNEITSNRYAEAVSDGTDRELNSEMDETALQIEPKGEDATPFEHTVGEWRDTDGWNEADIPSEMND